MKMQSLDFDAIEKEIEKKIPKQCKTCEENTYCDKAKKEVACKYWKPDFMLFQDVWNEVTKEMGINI